MLTKPEQNTFELICTYKHIWSWMHVNVLDFWWTGLILDGKIWFEMNVNICDFGWTFLNLNEHKLSWTLNNPWHAFLTVEKHIWLKMNMNVLYLSRMWLDLTKDELV